MDNLKIPNLPISGLESYNLPELPKGADNNYLAPNICLQSAMFGMVQRGRRKYLEKHKIVSFRNVNIFFTGGELDQGDFDVFLHAVHLTAKQRGQYKQDGLVEFSVRGFLRALNKHPGKSGQVWLMNSIRRLSSCLVEVHFGDEMERTVVSRFGNIYGGSLIHDFYYDSQKKKFFLRVNSSLGPLFRLGWTSLRWQQRMHLKAGLSKWLHGIYSTATFPMKVKTLKMLSRSKCKELYKFRQQLKRALEELIVINAIKSWEIDEEDKVHVINFKDINSGK